MSCTFADLGHIQAREIEPLEGHKTKFAAFFNSITDNAAADGMHGNKEQKTALHV
jgi:hypothetical protein